ncbi:Uncharacterised protein [Candidatus Tiddalikarchaeum anstoanum]|nr:Uncharacterised protein [Candidatus Tiddalikarchaeum anstoanum]
MGKSQINLLINKYDDLFSSFDAREYDAKSISDDFLNQCRKACLDKKAGDIELLIMVNDKIRSRVTEEIIKKRLKGHFSKHYSMIKSDRARIIRKSLIFITLGLIFSVLTTLTHYYMDEPKSLVTSMILIILEPASWFFLWEGLSILLFEPSKIKSELEFYNKMSNADILFESHNILL